MAMRSIGQGQQRRLDRQQRQKSAAMLPRALQSGMSGRSRGRALGLGWESRDPSIELPQLYVIAINELLRALLGCLVVLAINLDTAFNATIVA
jgi:hypothetical protein